jgi:hypothetical protein
MLANLVHGIRPAATVRLPNGKRLGDVMSRRRWLIAPAVAYVWELTVACGAESVLTPRASAPSTGRGLPATDAAVTSTRSKVYGPIT